MRFEWTDEAREAVKQGRDEKLSSSQIAAQLGCTRNAVIGIAHRMGLERLTVGNKTGRPRKEEATPMLIQPLFLVTIALLDHHCRQPVNEDGTPYTFCGHDKIEGSSYCAFHTRQNYLPMPVRSGGYFRLPGQAA